MKMGRGAGKGKPFGGGKAGRTAMRQQKHGRKPPAGIKAPPKGPGVVPGATPVPMGGPAKPTTGGDYEQGGF